MPQNVFDIGAAVGAIFSIDGDISPETIVSHLAEGYRSGYLDDNYSEQWVNGFTKLAENVKASYGHEFLKVRLIHFAFFRTRFDLFGIKRKKKILGGAMFTGVPDPNYDRVNVCLRNLRVYTVLAGAGSIPAPPPNWSPGKR